MLQGLKRSEVLEVYRGFTFDLLKLRFLCLVESE